jgi:branched-chain amino acid transport system ATP-binding protein
MGLAPVLVDLIFDTIKKLNEQGTTILLVEQNALMALSIAHRGYVLETGEIVLADERSKLKENEIVQKTVVGLCTC